MLRSDSPIDRYVAVKALGVIGGARDFQAISNLAEHDPEGRVALEAAASLTRLGSDHGLELLRAAIDDPQVSFLRMEAVLALSEFYGTPLATRCADLLTECAQAEALATTKSARLRFGALAKMVFARTPASWHFSTHQQKRNLYTRFAHSGRTQMPI